MLTEIKYGLIFYFRVLSVSDLPFTGDLLEEIVSEFP